MTLPCRRLALLLTSALLLAGGPSSLRGLDGLQSSAAGDRLKSIPPLVFRSGKATKGPVATIHLEAPRQRVLGVGGALTEASAFVLAHLPADRRGHLLDELFGPGGADLSLARLPIGACDFCVKGKFSYDDVPGDTALTHFSLAPDQAGFPDALDPHYALLDLIRDARTRNPALKLLASPWTAPSWMKDNGAWYGEGRGGRLLPEHQATYARYLVRYLQAMAAEGLPVWGLTPENEPLGNGGQWESMEFTADAMQGFIRDHLGPALAGAGLGGVRLIQYDHNRDAHALAFARATLGDPATARFVWGTGLHWYGSTVDSRTDLLDQLRRDYPGKALLHTEGCVDAIGTEANAPGGRFRGWQDDAWWWAAEAQDWGYTWAPPAEKKDHPPYAPVHRYARDLIEGFNHGFCAWLDWNLVLDQRGGPNHVGNFCAAPVMVDLRSGTIYRTPLLDVLIHASRCLRPGSRVVPVDLPPRTPLRLLATLSPDRRVLAILAFNPSASPQRWSLRLGRRTAETTLPPNALQSFRVALGRASRSRTPRVR